MEEAVFEVRFVPAVDSVVSLLPGVLFSSLSKVYTKHQVLPLASLPAELKAQQPDLFYAQQIRLLSEGVSSLFVGDRVVGASTMAPYPGWDAFQERVVELIGVVKASGLIGSVERASFKYVNILPAQTGQQLRALQATVMVGGKPASEEGFTLRTERNDPTYRRIIEITTNAVVTQRNGAQKQGLWLALDAIRPLPKGAGSDQLTRELAKAVHDEAKELFFGIITPEMRDSLGPEYEAT